MVAISQRFFIISATVLAVSIIGIVFFSTFQSGTVVSSNTNLDDQISTTDKGIQKISVNGIISLVVRDSSGEIKHTVTQDNLVVNNGLDFTASNVFATTVPATTMKFIALGDGGSSPSSSDTSLANEFSIISTGNSHDSPHPHYMRGISTVTNGVDIGGETIGNVQLNKTFAVVNHSSRTTDQQEGELILADGTNVSQTITEVGIFDSSSGGEMFSRVKISGNLKVQNGDTLEVTWKVDYD